MMERWAYLSDGAQTALGLSTTPGDDALTALVGWYGGVDFRTNRTNRLEDGTFPSRTVRGGRKLTLSGVVQRSTAAEIEAYERALSGMFPSGGQKGWLEAENTNGVLLCEGVEPDGEPRISSNLDYLWCEFEIPLFSPDPHLYGPVQQTTAWAGGIGTGLEYPLFDDGSGVTSGVLEYGSAVFSAPSSLTNLGNAIAYPKVTVEGTFPAGFKLSVSNGVRWAHITYRGPVNPGAPVLVDMSGSVTVNGVDQSRYLTERGWIGADPHGGQVTHQLTAISGGAGSARLDLRSTYL